MKCRFVVTAGMFACLGRLSRACFPVLLLLLMLGGQGLYAGDEPVRRRGRYLRTDVVKVEEIPCFGCALAATSGSYPVLQFRRQQRVIHHEVRVYEVVQEEMGYNEDAGRDTLSYRVVPGEELRGETNLRRSIRDLGPFADEDFMVGEHVFHTDAKGLAVDSEQVLLRPFDDMTCNTLEIPVKHAKLGETTLTLSRYLARRWSDEPHNARAESAQTDLLLALGLDYDPLNPSDNSGLQIEVSLPEFVSPGENVELIVKAFNAGHRTASCLIGRLFSRHPWFSDLNLYFGNIPGGATREFRRNILIPISAKSQRIYAWLGFWDIRGALRGRAQRIAIRVSMPKDAISPKKDAVPSVPAVKGGADRK